MAVVETLTAAWQHCSTIAQQKLTYRSPELLMTVLPVILYWAVAAFFEILDWVDIPSIRQYRLHSKETAAKRNLASRGHVAQRVLLQNAIQVLTGVAMAVLDPEFCDSKPYRGLFRSALEFVGAMLVMDAWQYFIHRAMHESKVLYNAIHSHHHRLLVCYAYGALYNHPLEAFLLDTVGGVVTYYASGISCKASVVFFTFATIKTVLDHSGYRYPVNLLHNVFPNNAAYHDAHHDLRGFRKNYSQPFFCHWDRLLGTYLDPNLLKGGGSSGDLKKAVDSAAEQKKEQ